ncbi:MAG TPA: hypothetical protein VLA02_06065 [Reyranella sp.]|nr:hypothetical protein [Reyranella sp.]
MLYKSLYRQTLVVCLFLISGCDVANNAQRDFNRVIHGGSSVSASARSAPASNSARPGPAAKPAATADARPETADARPEESRPPPRETASATPDVNLVGKSEGQVRALLGPPTSVEERAPGKTWHYRDGSCSVDVRLYPDVQTRQFGTLSYEVRSNDNSNEGRRDCMARFRSRSQSGPG